MDPPPSPAPASPREGSDRRSDPRAAVAALKHPPPVQPRSPPSTTHPANGNRLPRIDTSSRRASRAVADGLRSVEASPRDTVMSDAPFAYSRPAGTTRRDADHGLARRDSVDGYSAVTQAGSPPSVRLAASPAMSPPIAYCTTPHQLQQQQQYQSNATADPNINARLVFGSSPPFLFSVGGKNGGLDLD